MKEADIRSVASRFAFTGAFESAREIKAGNVNGTYHIVCAEGEKRFDYILQRVNGYVFPQPLRVVDNIVRVTEHLRKKLLERREDPHRRILRLVPTQNGAFAWQDEAGDVWRAYFFIDDAVAYDTVGDPDIFREVGRGFGQFQRLLADFPAEQLFIPIADFHNTPKRFDRFEQAIAADCAGRVAQAREEIDFLRARCDALGRVTALLDSGALPLRVTHNDTKSNNVMIDRRSGKALCVIDLDTVMPGAVLYDYGDAIRFGASTAPEDEPDTSRIALDLRMARAFTEGFLREVNGFLTPQELHLLPLGVKVMTGELAVRFLTDYLEGDRYFRILSPEHNLIRARAQIALLRDIERKEAALQAMVDELLTE